MLIAERLKALSDSKNAAFVAKLTPTVDAKRILGIRIPILRQFVKGLDSYEITKFLADVPHFYLEEDVIHVLALNSIRPVTAFTEAVESFFPFVNNWIVSDAIGPKFKDSELSALEPYLAVWSGLAQTYPSRMAALILMQQYLGEHFRLKHLQWVAQIPSDNYYSHMMIGWYFATALAKQPAATWPILKDVSGEGSVVLPRRAHRFALEKAIESRRISENLKPELKQFRAALKQRDTLGKN